MGTAIGSRAHADLTQNDSLYLYLCLPFNFSSLLRKGNRFLPFFSRHYNKRGRYLTMFFDIGDIGLNEPVYGLSRPQTRYRMS